MHALIVEDDAQLAEALVHILHREGYTVEAVSDGLLGFEYAQVQPFDVIIFDVMLPGLDGLSAVAKLREKDVKTPVLMLTALSAIPDRIDGLDSGADIYLTKPFSPKELLARLRALTRRHVQEAEQQLAFGDIVLQEQTRYLQKNAEQIQLSNKEFLLAKLLLSQPHTLVSREKIARILWGNSSQASENGIDSYISMLRKKLAFLNSCVTIKVERELGYRLECL